MPRRVSIVLFCTLSWTSVTLAAWFEHSVPMLPQASGNYYVKGSLSGVETEMLVDTGAGYVAVSKRTFESLKRATGTEFLRDVVGALANGATVKVPVYRVATLTLGSCALRDVEVAVVPGSTRDILGLSALRKAEPFALQLEPPQLLLSNCGAAKWGQTPESDSISFGDGFAGGASGASGASW